MVARVWLLIDVTKSCKQNISKQTTLGHCSFFTLDAFKLRRFGWLTAAGKPATPLVTIGRGQASNTPRHNKPRSSKQPFTGTTANQPHIRQRNRWSMGYWRPRSPRHSRVLCQRSPPCVEKTASIGSVLAAGGCSCCGSDSPCCAGGGPSCGSDRAALCAEARSRSTSETVSCGGPFAKHLPNREKMVYKIANCDKMNQNENNMLCFTISAMRAAQSIVWALALQVGTKLAMVSGGPAKPKLSTDSLYKPKC